MSEQEQALADAAAEAFSEWTTCLEVFTLKRARIDHNQWKHYVGRGSPVQWEVHTVGNDRSGPSHLKVSPDAHKAGRAIITNFS